MAVDRVVLSPPASLGNGARVRTREGSVVGRVAGATPR
jgi:hypothetical protein